MAKKKFYRPVLYGLLVVVRRFFMLWPYRWGFAFGGFMGRISFRLIGDEQKKVLSHLRLAYGDSKSEAELYRLGETVFENYGRTLAELALIEKIIPRFDDFVSAEGYEHFDKALAAGKGAVCVIAHFGNWEIMGGYTAMKGYPCTVIAKRIYYDKYDKLLTDLRSRMKVETIYRDSSPRLMLDVLRKNRMLGFVVDQDIEILDGVFVEFFGRPAKTPIAPVRFAMTSGAPILPVFIVREGMKHRMIVEPAVELSLTGNKEEDIRISTQRWVAVQEKMIRRYPHLWAWNHKRWKSQPKPA